MSFTRLRFWHVLPFALFAGAALIPTGCGDDGVSKYDVPKTNEQTKAEPAGPIEPMPGKYRILGAMFPAEQPKWFFKLIGPTEALDAHDAGFRELIESVSLPARGEPEFTLPKGWTRGPGREMVAATVKTPDGKYEVTIADAMGGVSENLKRWATFPSQLGNTSFTASDESKYTRKFQAKNVRGLLADLRGPNDPGAKKGGPMMGGKMPPNHP